MARKYGQDQGEVSEMKVAINLINNGCRVSQTFGHSHPYDLIADIDGELVKIQVKTAKPHKKGNQYFIKLPQPEKYDRQNVDMFAGYAPGEDGVFFIPYEEMGKRASVTFTPLENMGNEANQQRANHISDYTFNSALSRL